jgi:hypothetical protein
MDNLKLAPGDVLSEIVDKMSFANFVSSIFLYKKTGSCSYKLEYIKLPT